MTEKEEFLCQFNKKPGSLPENVSTFARLMQTAATSFPNRRFLGFREYLTNCTRGEFEWYLYKDVYRMIVLYCKALTEIGLKRGDRVGIISADRTEWNVTDIACSSLGISLVPIYDTQSVEDIKYVVNDAEIKVCFASIDKVDRVAGTGVQTIVVFDDRLDDKIWLRELKFKIPERVLFNTITAEECDLFDELEGILDTHLTKKEWLQFKKNRKTSRDSIVSQKLEGDFYEYIPSHLPVSVEKHLLKNKNPPNMVEVKYTFLQLLNLGYDLLGLDQKKNILFNNNDMNAIQLDYQTTKSDEIMTIVYTSGTTGKPKGVILKHSNVCWATYNMLSRRLMKEEDPVNSFGEKMPKRQEVSIAFLPYAHIYMRMLSGVMIFQAGCLGAYQGDTATLLEDVRKIRVTSFFLVPRIVNKLVEGIVSKVEVSSFIKKTLFNKMFAYRQSVLNGYKQKYNQQQLDYYDGKIKYEDMLHEDNHPSMRVSRFEYPAITNVVFNQFPAMIGGRCRLFVTGSAPMSQSHGDFMCICFNCHIFEGFGMTETCANGTVQSIHQLNFGYIGEALECDTQIKLRSIPDMDYLVTDKKIIELNGRQLNVCCPRGELIIKGPSVFSGYYKDPERTKEMIEDGWFLTGDVAEFDPVTRQIRIVDRKRGIMKLSQGEYISINQIEDAVSKSRFVEQVFVYASRYESFPLAVIVLNVPYVKAHYPGVNLEQAHLDPKVLADIQNDVKKVCKDAQLRSFEVPKAVFVDNIVWDQNNGLLTPGFKVKRPACQHRYDLLFKELYAQLKKLDLKATPVDKIVSIIIEEANKGVVEGTSDNSSAYTGMR